MAENKEDYIQEEELLKNREGEDQQEISDAGNGEIDKKETKLVEELGQKLMEMNDKYLRLSAEFDNYRKRT